ncbi:MAG: polysaccharide deacetylase family protein [Candidatus Limnocylindrales bacterium]
MPTRRTGKKAVLGVALILLMYTGVAAAYMPADPILPGGPTPGTPTPTPLVGRASASVPTPTVSPSPTTVEPTTSPSPSPVPTAPTPRPTAVPYREYHVPILMYHRIVPAAESGQDPNGLLIEPVLFRAQLQALYDAGWRTVTLAQLAQAMQDGTPLPPRTFVITIDDGWWDGYKYAFPILREFGFLATYLVISSRIDQVSGMTTDQLVELLAFGDEVGNHTENHVSLQTVNLATAKAEVDNASDKIEQLTGTRPVSLSYPMGGINQVALLAVNECPGLKIAVTESPGVTESWLNRFASPRVRVSPTTRPDRLVTDLTSRVGL